MLYEQLKVGDICVHGPVIPSPGWRDATIDAGVTLFCPGILYWRLAASEEKSRSSMREKIHTTEEKDLLRLSAGWARGVQLELAKTS